MRAQILIILFFVFLFFVDCVAAAGFALKSVSLFSLHIALHREVDRSAIPIFAFLFFIQQTIIDLQTENIRQIIKFQNHI